MAIYTDYIPVAGGTHAIFESSRLHCTEGGPIYDLLVVEDELAAKKVYLDVDNGTALKVGGFTGNGLQERYATIAEAKDMICVAGTPALIKTAFTKAQASPKNFYNVAGKDLKGYSVDDKFGETEIFGVSLEGFTEATQANVTEENVKNGLYVVVDGNGKWMAETGAPSASAYGFIGKVHSLATDLLNETTIVRIACIQNIQL